MDVCEEEDLDCTDEGIKTGELGESEDEDEDEDDLVEFGSEIDVFSSSVSKISKEFLHKIFGVFCL